MNDEQFDALMRDAARTYRRPPPPPDADALWTEIERTLPVGAAVPDVRPRPVLTVVHDDADATPGRRARIWHNAWLRAAAVLLLGVAIGRASVRRATPATVPLSGTATATLATASTPTIAAPIPDEPDATDAPDAAPRRPTTARQVTAAGTTVSADAPTTDLASTSAYLGRAQSLLAALPAELRAHRTDPAYLSRADALLLQTRLLLDSPASADPALHALFDDLEIVLAQVVRLKADRDPTRIDFLNQAIEQRDVLPRLRDAVADNAGD